MPCQKRKETKVDNYYFLGYMLSIVVTYEIRVFFEGAEKKVFSSIFKKTL
jgi:hypothetical protein